MYFPSTHLLRALRAINRSSTSGSSSIPSCILNPTSRNLHLPTTTTTITTQTRPTHLPSPRSTTNSPYRALSSTLSPKTSSPSPSPHSTRSRPPSSTDRGPASTESTQTDFSALDILSNTTAPATSIDACTPTGFHLNNGIKTSGGDGVILVGGEAFCWRPWEALGVNKAGDDARGVKPRPGPGLGLGPDGLLHGSMLSFPAESLALLDILHPKPDLMIIGTGRKVWPLSGGTRAVLNGLGIRLDVMDTRSACAAYNLLATERGVEGVAGLMLCVGWKGT